MIQIPSPPPNGYKKNAMFFLKICDTYHLYQIVCRKNKLSIFKNFGRENLLIVGMKNGRERRKYTSETLFQRTHWRSFYFSMVHIVNASPRYVHSLLFFCDRNNHWKSRWNILFGSNQIFWPPFPFRNADKINVTFFSPNSGPLPRYLLYGRTPPPRYLLYGRSLICNILIRKMAEAWRSSNSREWNDYMHD